MVGGGYGGTGGNKEGKCFLGGAEGGREGGGDTLKRDGRSGWS